MPKSKKNNHHEPKHDSGNDDDLESLLEEMPLAKAVLNKDYKRLEQIIQSSLPNKNNVTVQNLKMEQSAGEAFTGGRSTPVYYVQVTIVNNNNNNTKKDRYFVIKLVLMLGNNDGSTKTMSLLRKRESYAVERRFYQYIAPTLKQQQHTNTIAIPKLLASDHAGVHALPIACWLMTDVRVQFPYHPTVLNPKTHMLHALDWLANFHAVHWNDKGSGGTDWRRVVWERGGFWTTKTIPSVDTTTTTTSAAATASGGGSGSGSGISTTWLQTCQWMSSSSSSKHNEVVSPSLKTVGTRLQALYEPLSEFMMHQSKLSSWSTMIHGDFKAANLFFSNNNDDNDDGDNNNQSLEQEGSAFAAAVDFQYTGAGVPAEDVAYILFPDALTDYWNDEDTLLRYYHDQFMEALILGNKGGPSSLPYKSFVALYELSRLELLMYWIGKAGWVASTEGDAKLVVAVEKTLNKIDGGKVLGGGKKEYKKALEDFTTS